jgi:hypothetical protein
MTIQIIGGGLSIVMEVMMSIMKILQTAQRGQIRPN